MDEVTIAGGVSLINVHASLKGGEFLFIYGSRCVSHIRSPKRQTLYISRGNFSRNTQPSIHISAKFGVLFLFVKMTDITLSENMGGGLCITNVISPVLLQSVFITGNLNGGVEIHHSNVTFSGTTTLTHNRGKPFYIHRFTVY